MFWLYDDWFELQLTVERPYLGDFYTNWLYLTEF